MFHGDGVSTISSMLIDGDELGRFGAVADASPACQIACGVWSRGGACSKSEPTMPRRASWAHMVCARRCKTYTWPVLWAARSTAVLSVLRCETQRGQGQAVADARIDTRLGP